MREARTAEFTKAMKATHTILLPDADFAKMKELAAPIINKGCNTGEPYLAGDQRRMFRGIELF